MSDIKNAPKNAGQKNTDNARNADRKTTQANKQNKGSEQENSALDESNCGQARQLSDIQPHMDVISSCGCTMGKVDHLEGNAIKLTKNDSPDGQHHFIPTNWVESVDNHIHLRKNAEETLQEWKSDAASCANCSA